MTKTKIKIELTPSQRAALSLPHRFKGFCAGYAGGKSFLQSYFLVKHHHRYPGTTTALYEPVYRLLRDVFYPSIEQVMEMVEGRIEVNFSDPYVKLFNYRNEYIGKVLCRSLSEPAKIVGYQCSACCVDEADTLDMLTMQESWLKIIARLRLPLPDGAPNEALIGSTPEGFGWLYHRFHKEKGKDYGLVQASTYENAHNLPVGFIDSMRDSYDEQRLEAYLMGQFVNLMSQPVYYNFDRVRNHRAIVAEPGEPLHIGMDMNVGAMAATIHVNRDDNLVYHPGKRLKEKYERAVCVDEVFGVRDTPDLIQVIRQRYPDHPVITYPDASGVQRHSADAAITDIKQLKLAGFKVEAPRANPRIKDRVANMNAVFGASSGRTKYFINVDECPEYVQCLEQQSYDPKTNLPDKDSGLDHLPDSGGYFVTRRLGISRPITSIHDLR